MNWGGFPSSYPFSFLVLGEVGHAETELSLPRFGTKDIAVLGDSVDVDSHGSAETNALHLLIRQPSFPFRASYLFGLGMNRGSYVLEVGGLEDMTRRQRIGEQFQCGRQVEFMRWCLPMIDDREAGEWRHSWRDSDNTFWAHRNVGAQLPLGIPLDGFDTLRRGVGSLLGNAQSGFRFLRLPIARRFGVTDEASGFDHQPSGDSRQNGRQPDEPPFGRRFAIFLALAFIASRVLDKADIQRGWRSVGVWVACGIWVCAVFVVMNSGFRVTWGWWL